MTPVTFEWTSNESSGERPVDILVFVAHLQPSPAALDDLVHRVLRELNWGAIATDISVIVPDTVEPNYNPDSRIKFIRASAAASEFRDRCRVLESSPRDFLISFGEYLPSIEVIGQLRAASRSDEMVSAVAPRVAIGPNGELM